MFAVATLPTSRPFRQEDGLMLHEPGSTNHRPGLVETLESAIALRQAGDDHAARTVLLELHEEYPDDARVNLQCARIHDKLGMEREAVPFYEKAIHAGLEGGDLHDALLGLGSTYRALGEYEKSLEILDRAVTEMPDDRGLRVFRAMALYNNARHKEACETLLRLLVETTGDEDISVYRPALAEYAEDLDRTWA
jgi:tetratricopeptide (TPR) repeat protein